MGARGILVIVLLVSAALRVEIARRGGQFYWPDESRYSAVRRAADALVNGDGAAFAEQMVSTSDHVLFRFIALVPALLERGWTPPAVAPPWLAAVYFGLFGVGAILMVWLIVRRVTHDEAAATWSAVCYAGLGSAFLFARHYFPYDAGLFLLLLGAWLGLRARSFGGCWCAGVVVGCGYLTYNAYWNVGGLILVALAFWQTACLSDLWRRAAALGLGLITPILAVYGGAALLGYNLLEHARSFSHTVVQGDFGRGWWFILSYFAAVDGAYALWLLVLAVAGVVWALIRNEWRYAVWLGLGLVLAAEIIVLSDVIPRFAVAGRMVKPLMLFVAVAAGTTLARLLAGRKLGWTIAAALVTAGLAAQSIRPVMTLVFPENFRRQAERLAAEVRTDDPSAVLQLYYAGFMHRPKFLEELPPHEVLAQARHPHQFVPYLFEGYAEDARAQFQAHDFSMRLVRLRSATQQPPAAAVAPYPGVLELELELPTPRPVGQVEPLLVTGEAGRGDLLSLAYLDEERVQLVADHWGWGDRRSEPFVVSSQGPHHLLISSGALLPPPEDAWMEQHPALRPLTGRLVVEWNSEVVARLDLPFYAVTLDRVFLGQNAIGGSTAKADFTGEVRWHRWLNPRLVATPGWGLDVPERKHGGWGSPSGPQQAVLQLEPSGWPVGQGRVLARVQRGFDQLDLRARREPGGVRYSLWRAYSLWTDLEQLAESEVLPLRPEVQVLISAGLATPPESEVPVEESLRARWLGQNTVVIVDDQVVFDSPVSHTGLDMAVTLAGVPDLPTRWSWAGEPMPIEGQPDSGHGQLIRTAPIPLEVFSPIAGLTTGQATWGSCRVAPADRVELTLKLPQTRPRSSEPLLVAGRTGAADALFLTYEEDGRLRIGHDHWGAALVLSEPFEARPADEHHVVISLAEEAAVSDVPRRTGLVTVTWNGQRVLEAPARPVYQVRPHELAVGLNLVGIGTCGVQFSGRVLQAHVSTDDVPERDEPATVR